MSSTPRKHEFIMVTDGDATQDEFIFESDLVHTTLMSVNTENDTFKIKAWFCHDDTPIEIYDGKRGTIFYDRFTRRIRGRGTTISIEVQDVDDHIIRIAIRIEYLQTVLLKRNKDIDGKTNPIGRILITVKYNDTTQHFSLYEGDMRTCFVICRALAKELDNTEDAKLIQLHSAPNESENVLAHL